MQRAPQPATRGIRVGFGPQQARHVVTANRRARIGEIGEQAQALAQGEIYPAAAEAQGWEPEKLNLQASHHESLMPRVRTGDGPGTPAY